MLHALGEFGVTYEELRLPKINGEELPSTYILTRQHDGNTYVFSGVFEPSETVLPHALEAICRRLNLSYRSIFGQ